MWQEKKHWDFNNTQNMYTHYLCLPHGLAGRKYKIDSDFSEGNIQPPTGQTNNCIYDIEKLRFDVGLMGLEVVIIYDPVSVLICSVGQQILCGLHVLFGMCLDLKHKYTYRLDAVTAS